MLWSNRRVILGRCAAVLGVSIIAGCGFTPVYGPEGEGNKVLGKVAFQAPTSKNSYIYVRRLEERLGRVSGPYILESNLSLGSEGLGSTSSGETTRYRRDGQLTYELKDIATKKTLITGSTTAFTGYSYTGSTVATLAAENDANKRLMVILADQVIDDLLLQADQLPDVE